MLEQSIKKVSRTDRIDQMENGLHSTNLSQWSNGVLVLGHSGCKESESNGSYRNDNSYDYCYGWMKSAREKSTFNFRFF